MAVQTFSWRFWKREKAAPAITDGIPQKRYTIEELLLTITGGKAQFQKWDAKEAIENGLRASAIFYACVNQRAQAISQVPWRVYKKAKNKDDTREELPEHPLQKLIDNPNPDFSWAEIMSLCSQHIDLAGNFYMAETRAGNTRTPIELMPLVPYGVKIIPGVLRLVEAYEYTGQSGRKLTFSANDVVQIKTTNPNDFLFGMPTIQAAGRAVDIDRSAGAWQKSSLDNRGVSDYAIVLDSDTTQDQYDRLREYHKERQAGPENARKPFFTTKDVKPLNQSAVEMDFVNSRLSTWQEIASAMGVPLPMIGVLADATLANIETSRRIFWTDTIVPLLRMIKDQLNAQLAIEFGADIELDYDLSGVEAMREDMGLKLDNARKLWDMAVDLQRINKMLELDIPDIETLEGSDVGYINAGLLPAGEDFSDDMAASDNDPDAARAAFGDPNARVGAEGPDVQQAALNGAQMASLQSIAQAVADNMLPAETALALVMVSIPGISEQTARAIITPAENFTPAQTQTPSTDPNADDEGQPDA